MTGDDHVLGRDLAGQAGRRLLELRARVATRTCCARPATGLSHEFLTAALAALRPATWCSPRRAPTTPRGSVRAGSGSSIRWTAQGVR